MSTRSSQKIFTIDRDQTVDRDGLTYHKDTTKLVTGIVESLHENGQLEMRGTYKDGKPDGLWEKFYENGHLKERNLYRGGDRIGFSDSFYENGQLFDSIKRINEDETVVGDRKDDPIVGYEAYICDLRYKYTNEPVTGIVESFHENGQLGERTNYIDGLRVGLRERFDEKGHLEERKTYTGFLQIGFSDSFYENGQLKERYVYIDGKMTGPYEMFYYS